MIFLSLVGLGLIVIYLWVPKVQKRYKPFPNKIKKTL